MSLDVFSGVRVSVGALASAGFVLGKVRQPGQPYLSISVGPGSANLADPGSDENGERNCFF